nr:hypothetical protein CFP56_44441 [Quercus suber]
MCDTRRSAELILHVINQVCLPSAKQSHLRAAHSPADLASAYFTRSHYHTDALLACRSPGDRGLQFTGCLQKTFDRSKIVDVAVTDPAGETDFGVQISRLQELLLLPGLATFNATTIKAHFGAPQALLKFLQWCLQKEQARWLGYPANAEEDLVDLLELTLKRAGTDPENPSATDLLSLLFNRYRMQVFLLGNPVLGNSAALSRQKHDNSGLHDGVRDDESCSSFDGVESLNSKMTYGQVSGGIEAGMDTVVDRLQISGTALNLGSSAWTDDLLKQIGAQFEGANGY